MRAPSPCARASWRGDSPELLAHCMRQRLHLRSSCRSPPASQKWHSRSLGKVAARSQRRHEAAETIGRCPLDLLIGSSLLWVLPARSSAAADQGQQRSNSDCRFIAAPCLPSFPARRYPASSGRAALTVPSELELPCRENKIQLGLIRGSSTSGPMICMLFCPCGAVSRDLELECYRFDFRYPDNTAGIRANDQQSAR